MDIVDIKNISNSKVLTSTKNLWIIDVREKNETKYGYIKNPIFMPISAFDSVMLFYIFLIFCIRFPACFLSTDPIFCFYCKSGYRSFIAAKNFRNDFPGLNVYNMNKGITDWIKKGYKVNENLHIFL